MTNIGVDDRSFRATFTKKRRHYASELPKKLKTLYFPLTVRVDTAFRAIRKSRSCHASYQLPELINVFFRTTWKKCCSSYQLSSLRPTTFGFLISALCFCREVHITCLKDLDKNPSASIAKLRFILLWNLFSVKETLEFLVDLMELPNYNTVFLPPLAW